MESSTCGKKREQARNSKVEQKIVRTKGFEISQTSLNCQAIRYTSPDFNSYSNKKNFCQIELRLYREDLPTE